MLNYRRGSNILWAGLFCLTVFSGVEAFAAGEPAQVFSNRPNPVSFPPIETRYVRFVIHETNGGAPCLDELEIYGQEDDKNLALAEGALASASSCIVGHPIHAVEHLNDGKYGNDNSWVSAEVPGPWAQIELPVPAQVARVVFSRDRHRQYNDRMPVKFDVLVSMDGTAWQTAASVTTTAGAVALASPGDSGSGRIPSPPPPPNDTGIPAVGADADALLRYAFLAEEHAWVKAHGRADLDPRLVPYNGRVQKYPRHAGDDEIPLPELPAAPSLDANAPGDVWQHGSQGVARVAWPYDFGLGPLVAYTLKAGTHEGFLYLSVQADRLLSAHVAAISTPDFSTSGVLLLEDGNLLFRVFGDGDNVKDLPVEGGRNASFTTVLARVPLEWFPGCETSGFRIGLGMGGRHTSAAGRPVLLKFADFLLAQETSPGPDTFALRLATRPGAAPKTIRYKSGDTFTPVTLAPGQPQVLLLPAPSGPVGPELTLEVREDNGETYTVHLFRYDPLARTLALFEEMLARFESAGIPVETERAAFDSFRLEHARLLALPQADTAAERKLFFTARSAKRTLLMRSPDLDPIGKILCVKRNPFEPSHNYSDYFDSAFRPGGGIFILDIPKEGDRFVPERAVLTRLFDAGGGIARNPMADFDLKRIYFSYRPDEKGYYHVMSMNPDGSDLRQLTDGPFQDLFPCPLPDGNIAMISTRCKQRFICWRPQASVLFRMRPDGTELTPLSFANLTEWATSVMSDGRIIWTRSEYQDKGADFGHTLWAIRPDGTHPELIFGNSIIQPNGYANGREVPGTKEYSCTLISHFGDLNGPVALVDTGKGRFNPEAITSLTPEVPWPGMWPGNECFREPLPLSRDYFLCAHAPRDSFGLYVIDRFGNRELLYLDPALSCMGPTPFRIQPRPPLLAESGETPATEESMTGEFILQDVYAGISPPVARGAVKYIRVAEEVRATLDQMPDGTYRSDHPEFQDWYATPVHKVSGPHGWPTYVAKASHGIVPVEADGSARFTAPAGKVLYFQALDENFNELQRMRSVVQLQPGEVRSCIGCHEGREQAPSVHGRMMAQRTQPPLLASWEDAPFSYERVVQPVLDKHCAACHNDTHPKGLDFRGFLDADRVPASYRTLIEKGLVHYADMGWNSGGCEKMPPLSLGTLKSKLWETLNAGHHNISLSGDEMLRIKTWIDLNCPLWPDYRNRLERPATAQHLAQTVQE